MEFLKYFDHEELFYLRDHLRGLIEDIYQTGSIEDLEFHLHEVFACFDIELPKSAPVLMRRPTITKLDTILSAWKHATVSYGKVLSTGTNYK